MTALLVLASAVLAGAAAVVAFDPFPAARAARLGRGPEPDGRPDWAGRLRVVARPRLARGSASAQRLRAVQALAALASELESGQPPLQALANAGGEPSAWPRAAAASAHGDVLGALRADGASQPAIALLAACWEVGADSGAGLAAAVSRLARSARAEEDIRVQLEAQLAGPRASARMLGLLPVVGIGMGMLMGAEPLSWLTGTLVGLACLVAGVSLTVLGMWWTSRIAARVEGLL